MVAISLYRGDLHRLPPDVNRRWLMPRPTINPSSFRSLLRRRARALDHPPSTDQDALPPPPPPLPLIGVDTVKPEISPAGRDKESGTVAIFDKEPDSTIGGVETEKAPVVEENHVPDPAVEKRRKELEEKLVTLKDRKHQLVQALKIILNVEEEMKKRSSLQANGSRELEGESHMHQMHVASPSAASPLARTASSPFQHSVAPFSNRVNHPATGHGSTISNALGAYASPSRFAPPVHHAHPSSLLSVSVSGTQYAASSPSPAASGGTSAFRDGRLTSPSWN